MLPVIFIGHGTPMNAIEDNEFSGSWREMGKTLPRPDVVLCISAHWETDGVFVSTTSKPEMIYDFFRFPQELYKVIYPAPGPDYVWVGGCWTWYGDRWCWARGHWAYPPYRGAYWYGGRWDHRGGSHVWIGGYWR